MTVKCHSTPTGLWGTVRPVATETATLAAFFSSPADWDRASWAPDSRPRVGSDPPRTEPRRNVCQRSDSILRPRKLLVSCETGVKCEAAIRSLLF